MSTSQSSNIKESFVSRHGDDGWIMEVDYGQLEVVYLAVISGDNQLKADILDGTDMHCVSAEWVTGVPYEKIRAAYLDGDKYLTKVRKEAKAPRFALSYGAGASSLSQYFDNDKAKAQSFIDKYYNRYPQVKAWQKSIADWVNHNAVPSGEHTDAGYPEYESTIRMETGRRYTFTTYDNPFYDPNRRWGKSEPTNFSPTQMKNFPVQGGATGDIVPMAFAALSLELYSDPDLVGKAVLLNTVHDSVLLDVHNDVLDKTARLTKRVLESAPSMLEEILGMKFDLPLPVDVDIGKNWHNMKSYSL